MFVKEGSSWCVRMGDWQLGEFFISRHTRHLRAQTENSCGSEAGCRVDTVALRSLPVTLRARTEDRCLLEAVALQGALLGPGSFLPRSQAPLRVLSAEGRLPQQVCSLAQDLHVPPRSAEC